MRSREQLVACSTTNQRGDNRPRTAPVVVLRPRQADAMLEAAPENRELLDSYHAARRKASSENTLICV